MHVIPGAVKSRIPLIETIWATYGFVTDVQDIIDSTTPAGAAKIIGGRFLKECTPPSIFIFITGKRIMLIGGVVSSAYTGGNPLVVSATIPSARLIVKDIGNTAS